MIERETYSVSFELARKRGVLRGGADDDFVNPRQLLPAVRLLLEDLQQSRINRNGNCLFFAGFEFHALPARETLIRLASFIGQRNVNLRDLRSRTIPCVFEAECDIPILLVIA